VFLNPLLFAVGAGAIAVPILIHLLLRQRRRPIEWAAMRFLLAAYRKRRRVLTLQQLLLLACRCLLLLFIALAIGRLITESGARGGSGDGRDVYILLDNSIASALTAGAGSEGDATGGERGAALDRHLRTARRVLGSVGVRDRVALITLAGPAEAIAMPPAQDADAVSRLLSGVRTLDAPADIAGALRLVAGDLGAGATGDGESAANRSAEVMIISDMPAGVARTSEPLAPVLGPAAAERSLTVRVAGEAAASTGVLAGAQNVSVAAVEPLERLVLAGEDAGRDVPVTVRLVRSGAGATGALTGSVRLWAAASPEDRTGLPAASEVVTWAAGQRSASVTVPLPAAAGAGRRVIVAESDNDALAADNIAAAAVLERRSLRVGVIGPRRFGAGPGVAAFAPADWLAAALAPDEGGAVTLAALAPSAVDDVGLSRLDAALLPVPHLMTDAGWRALARFVERGGLLFVTPPAGETIHLWTEPFTEALRLPWSFERESGAPASATLDAESAAEAPLLSLIAGELAELARPVRVQRTLALESAPGSADVLLRLSGGEAWMIAESPAAGPSGNAPRATSDAEGALAGPSRGRGLVVYWASAVDPDWSTAPLLPIMVPLLNETIRQGVGDAAAGVVMEAGSTVAAPAGAVEHRSPGGEVRTVSEGTPIALRTAGEHTLIDAAGRAVLRVLVNPSTRGADVDPVEQQRIAQWLSGAAPGASIDAGGAETAMDGESASRGEVVGRSERTPLDALFLALAAAFAVLETALARWFSHASRSDSGSADAGGGA
jgi:hypothetical protein